MRGGGGGGGGVLSFLGYGTRWQVQHVIFLAGLSMFWVTIGILFFSDSPGPGAFGPGDDPLDLGTATSGKLFSGQKIRTFPSDQLLYASSTPFTSDVHADRSKHACRRWSVVTTIFDPSDSIKRQANLGPDWCIVIVGDRKSPSSYHVKGSSQVVYLSASDQEAYGLRIPDMFGALPWNHFGRKNVGFLYAIEHGAEFIWDFDDDNQLKDGRQIPTPAETDQVAVRVPVDHQFATYNPYVKMGAPHLPAWPRGLPLTHIKDKDSFETDLVLKTVPGRDIGLIQSLADHDPDMDAIYRLTQPLPFEFVVPADVAPIQIPAGTLVPLNAQACLFRQPAFWMLLLPISVHGRVSDIWRGYAGQRLLWDLGLSISFSAPIVDQFRNAHNYLADFESEIPLYTRAGALVDFLREWNGTATTLPGRIEALWVDLYERGFIQLQDVHLQQYWIKALHEIGYQFPDLVRP